MINLRGRVAQTNGKKTPYQAPGASARNAGPTASLDRASLSQGATLEALESNENARVSWVRAYIKMWADLKEISSAGMAVGGGGFGK